MRRIAIAILLCFIVSGCALLQPIFERPTKYYLDPESKGYYEPGLGGICEKCYQEFRFSKHQLDTEEKGKCPYCGHTQNLKDAANRYTENKERTAKKK